MKECVRIVVAVLCLFAVQVKAKEFAFDFSSQGMGDASAPVCSFAVGDRINLSLPDGRSSFALEIVSAPPPGIAGQSFIAKDTESNVGAIVKPRAGGILITVDDFAKNKIYTFNIKDGSKTFAVREKTSVPDECATCNGLDASNGANSSSVNAADIEATDTPSSVRSTRGSASRLLVSSDNSFPLAEQKIIIDILVAFDQGAIARAATFGYSTTEEFADYAINKMNMVLEKSQLLDKFSYRLVGIVEVDATYDVINDNLLNALRLRNSGALAPVGVARERYGADTITLLIDRDRNKSNTSGLGYEYLSNSWSYASFDSIGYTCNICDIKTVYERYTMSHETGHNMGCGHSNRQGTNSGPGCNPYSCGYHFQDAAGTNRHTIMAYENTSPASGTYYPVPYFSSPDITPEELGVPVGTPTNNNRLTILNNYKAVSGWREHVMPYSWDVRFLDENGNDIPDGTYFSPSLYVTFSHENPNARIYYTYGGTTPTETSAFCSPGTRFTFTGTRTITACAVIDGVAQSVRTVTFNEGLSWSGETGENGDGVWKDGDSSVLSWNNSTSYFYSYMDAVVFPDLADNASPKVTVHGVVVPTSAAFPAEKTAYTFEKGTADALIRLRDASFAPAGDLTFNVPVQFDAAAFTNPASHTLAFNAPFGQIVTETSGYCTNMIGIGGNGRLVVSPGAGKTQTFDKLDTDWFYSSARFCVGEGTVVFKGPSDPDKGIVANTGISVGGQGCLVFDTTGKIAGIYSSLSGEGTVVCKAVAAASSLKLTDAAWKGTLAFEDLVADPTTQNFQFELYGNANSRILLRNCAISYLNGNNATFLGTLVLEKDAAGHAAFTTVNGSSGKYNVFGVLEGDGAMSFATGQRQGYVFNVATNYTGDISVDAQNNYGVVGGRYIVFGQVTSASDLPSQSATITVKPGATASIGGDATWYAYHGVEIGGTLLVKGAYAKIDCNNIGNLGLKLVGGAILRFDSADAKLTFGKAPRFASGTAHVAFGAGLLPQGGAMLVAWPTNAEPEGAFAFADSTLAAAWDLCKTATGLVVKPKNRFDIPGSEGAYIAESDRLSAWLDDNNFELYELSGGTWQEFLDETGANGYANWMNFALGLSAEDASDTFKIAIRRKNGKFVISPLKPVYEGLRFTTTLYGAATFSSELPEIDTFDGVVLELAPFADSAAGFYKVGISIKGP